MAHSEQQEQARREAGARRVLERLVGEGYRALYAGGYVRDKLLGVSIRGDIDIATNAKPTTVMRLFERTAGVGAHFGVVIVIEGGIGYEVATFRSDVGIADGRHPEAVVFSDERTDAQRRDFTINGMFYDPLTDEVLDYVGGKRDLSRGEIRSIGDPGQRFKEDFLRLLRAVRFAARFEFDIERHTWNALVSNAGSIAGISAERIFQELDRMLRGPHPDHAIRLLHRAGLLGEVLPEVSAMDGVPQPPQFHPEGDVFDHTVLALSLLASPTQSLAWSVLLHDIGKPRTMAKTDRIRFNNHDTVGAQMATAVLERLRAPRALIDSVTATVGNHMRFMHVEQMRVSTLKRFLSRPTMDDELELHRIDCIASHGMLDKYEYVIAKRNEFAKEGIRPAPLLRGRDLLSLGFLPGPKMGEVLRRAYDLQLENALTSRQEAMAWAQRTYKADNTST